MWSLLRAPPHPSPDLSSSHQHVAEHTSAAEGEASSLAVAKIKVAPDVKSRTWKCALFPLAANCQVRESWWKLISKWPERHRCPPSASLFVWPKSYPDCRLHLQGPKIPDAKGARRCLSLGGTKFRGLYPLRSASRRSAAGVQRGQQWGLWTPPPRSLPVGLCLSSGMRVFKMLSLACPGRWPAGLIAVLQSYKLHGVFAQTLSHELLL